MDEDIFALINEECEINDRWEEEKMGYVCDINMIQTHKVSEVICINCKKRWIATRPVGTLLKELECPQCGEQGYTIETGERTRE